jgi:hypothetical protein
VELEQPTRMWRAQLDPVDGTRPCGNGLSERQDAGKTDVVTGGVEGADVANASGCHCLEETGLERHASRLADGFLRSPLTVASPIFISSMRTDVQSGMHFLHQRRGSNLACQAIKLTKSSFGS